jgi:hypothetical protein
MMSHNQQVILRQYLHPVEFKAGDVVFRAGENAGIAVIVDSGSLRLEVNQTKFDPDGILSASFPSRSEDIQGCKIVSQVLSRGAFAGDVTALAVSERVRNRPQVIDGIMETSGVLLVITNKNLNAFFESFPGILVALYDTLFRL